MKKSEQVREIVVNNNITAVTDEHIKSVQELTGFARIVLSQFRHVSLGALFECNGTMYRKINGRMAQIEMPNETYNGKKFYFGWSELCRVIEERN